MAKKKLALCVGINDYPGTGNDLAGCVNDAYDFSKALIKQGYSVSTLLDHEATKQRVVVEIKRLLSECVRGDRFVFTYSGHGTWMPDVDGDEADHRDEALVMYDFSNGGLLSDDEMHTLFQHRRSGVRVTVFSDSCHSGTMARFVQLQVREKANARVKFLSPAMFTDLSIEQAKVIERETVPAPSRPGTVLISGCADSEYSYDASFGGRPNGAMTYHAVRALEAGCTTKGVFNKIRKSLPSSDYPQTPQLTASTYQKYTPIL